MALMPARFQEDFAEIGGALATGAALESYSMFKEGDKEKRNYPLMIDLAVGVLGILGATQMPGLIANLSEGVAVGAVAHAGSYLYRLSKTKLPESQQPESGIQALYNTSEPYIGTSGVTTGIPVIEI